MVWTWQEDCRRRKNLKFNIQKTDKWKFFDVLSMNGIENYPAAGEIFL